MKCLFAMLAGLWLATLTGYSRPADSKIADTLTITVQTPDGRPATNATVVCIDSKTRGALMDTNIQGGSERFQTDDHGRFTFSLDKGDLAFMVATDTGFGLGQIRDLTNEQTLVVQPWGRIAGTRTNRGRPVAGQSIMLVLDGGCVDDPQHLGVFDEAKTDAQGHFTFDHVPYLNLALMELERSQTMLGILRRIAVNPGQTKPVQITTDGRTIVGEVEYDKGLTNIPGPLSCDVDLTALAGHHAVLPPIPAESDTPEKRVQWYADTFDLAVASQVSGFLPPDQEGTDFSVQPDGSLISEVKVAPGTYWLNGDLAQNRKPVARINQFVDIPPDQPGDTNDVYDIGKVLVKPLMTVGSPAPDFDVPNLDGKRLKLSDFRGKYVLLDFWATWCVPCIYEIPNLLDTRDAYGKDSRFVMVSLDLDDDPAAPKTFTVRHDMDWTMAFLGDWDQDKVTKMYEIEGIPSIWLIGPDGKIIARDLRGPAIKETVAEALKSK
jgi:thiol-disulfide isomerase/thioredoxin